MALVGMHVPSVSKEILRLSSEVFGRGDFAAVCKHRGSFTSGRGMLECMHLIHTRAASASPNIERKGSQSPLIIKCRGSNGTSDKRGDPQSTGPFRQFNLGRTRLTKIIQEAQNKLISNIKGLQKNLPMKVFCLLLGFYCSTVLVTSIGQTGDWDILSAGLAVAIIEGIGALMYRAYPLIQRLHSLLTLINYWKAGLSLGLFLDAFKYEMDAISLFFDSFLPEIDLFAMFWW